MRAALLGFAALGAMSISAPGLAQDTGNNADDPNQAINLCSQMSSAELRIACLEAAVEAAYSQSPYTRGTVPAPVDQPVQTASGDSEIGSERNGLLGRVFGRGESSTATATVSGTSVAGIGAEQVEARNRTRQNETQVLQSASTRIASSRIHGYASLEITLENGQVWRQLQGDNQRIDADDVVGSDIEIRESRLGGYRLHLNDIDRIIRARRVE